MYVDELIRSHRLVTDQITKDELRVLLRALTSLLDKSVPGDIVEFGCFEGTAALFMQRLIGQCDQHKRLYLYDSFAGLPDKTVEDASPTGEQFKGGELNASKKRLIQHFRQANLPMPIIKKAWFSDLSPADLPEQIAFAFLDGDFYESIMDSLTLVWPKLAPGAVVVIDDYQTEALPGVRKAVERWSLNHNFTLRIEASLAILIPRV